nr:transposase [Longilinea arvoryzae]
MPFTIIASVILPDHIHFIWELPLESGDYSTRWRMIKSYFTRNWKVSNGPSASISRQSKGEREIWQRRFWEHYIRNEDDLACHIEYIHYNPVKHGLVDSPVKWKYSSFLKFVQNGYYPTNWGEDGQVWSGEEGME